MDAIAVMQLTLRRIAVLLALALMQTSSAWAVDASRRFTQYAHSAWRMQDGAFNSAPRSIVQAPDGYILLGTADGVHGAAVSLTTTSRSVSWRFVPTARGSAGRRRRLSTTYATPDISSTPHPSVPLAKLLRRYQRDLLRLIVRDTHV